MYNGQLQINDLQNRIILQNCEVVNPIPRIHLASVIIDKLEVEPTNSDLINKFQQEWPGFSSGYQDQDLELSKRFQRAKGHSVE